MQAIRIPPSLSIAEFTHLRKLVLGKMNAEQYHCLHYLELLYLPEYPTATGIAFVANDFFLDVFKFENLEHIKILTDAIEVNMIHQLSNNTLDINLEYFKNVTDTDIKNNQPKGIDLFLSRYQENFFKEIIIYQLFKPEIISTVNDKLPILTYTDFIGFTEKYLNFVNKKVKNKEGVSKADDLIFTPFTEDKQNTKNKKNKVGRPSLKSDNDLLEEAKEKKIKINQRELKKESERLKKLELSVLKMELTDAMSQRDKYNTQWSDYISRIRDRIRKTKLG